MLKLCKLGVPEELRLGLGPAPTNSIHMVLQFFSFAERMEILGSASYRVAHHILAPAGFSSPLRLPSRHSWR
jgi:hypothetical protein